MSVVSLADVAVGGLVGVASLVGEGVWVGVVSFVGEAGSVSVLTDAAVGMLVDIFALNGVAVGVGSLVIIVSELLQAASKIVKSPKGMHSLE